MAKTATYSLISSQTVSGSSTTTVTFSSIPSTYTDLVLVSSLQNNNNADSNQAVYVQFNGDTGTNYSVTSLRGNGSAATSLRYSSTATGYIGNTHPLTSSGWGNFILQINDYSNATTYKTGLARVNNTNSSIWASVMLWRSTAAINQVSVKIEDTANSWSAGSTFKLYGIEAYK